VALKAAIDATVGDERQATEKLLRAQLGAVDAGLNAVQLDAAGLNAVPKSSELNGDFDRSE